MADAQQRARRDVADAGGLDDDVGPQDVPGYFARARAVYHAGTLPLGDERVALLPQFTPWVLVNHTGKVRDVTMLAHELGHAIHSMMAEHHSLFTQHSSLPLA